MPRGSPLDYIFSRWWPRSLGGKLLLPIVALMLASLLVTTLAFVAGTALTRNQLLEQQVAADADRVAEAMSARVEVMSTAATLLGNDPTVVEAIQQDSETALSTLNTRAVVVRDRFGLDLIQIYDREGQARTNLLLSALYRESSLLDQVSAGQPAVRVVNDRLLLLSRVPIAQGDGTVVVGQVDPGTPGSLLHFVSIFLVRDPVHRQGPGDRQGEGRRGPEPRHGALRTAGRGERD